MYLVCPSIREMREEQGDIHVTTNSKGSRGELKGEERSHRRNNKSRKKKNRKINMDCMMTTHHHKKNQIDQYLIVEIALL